MNAYKVTGQRPVDGHAPGEEFEAEYTVDQEADYLSTGRLEIVPRPYKVIGTSRIFEGSHASEGANPGDILIAALPIERERWHLDGGRLERAPRTPERRKEAAKELRETLKEKE